MNDQTATTSHHHLFIVNQYPLCDHELTVISGVHSHAVSMVSIHSLPQVPSSKQAMGQICGDPWTLIGAIPSYVCDNGYLVEY